MLLFLLIVLEICFEYMDKNYIWLWQPHQNQNWDIYYKKLWHDWLLKFNHSQEITQTLNTNRYGWTSVKSYYIGASVYKISDCKAQL